MISSCVFTFDESSVWDPKVIREYLDIPDDQLNILRNLPEWSKNRPKGNTSRIEKDTCENSRPSQFISNARNEELITQNRILFDESFETHKSTLEAYKLKSKLFRSYSLFEIDRISNNSFHSHHLRSTLSIPNIYLFPENLYPKTITSELKKRDSSDRHLLPINNNIDLSVYKESEKAYITEQTTNKDTLELEKSSDKICSERSNMEVDAQSPVIIPCLVNQIKNSETNLEILVENKALSTNHALKSPNKFTSNDQLHNSNSGINTKAASLTTSDNISLCEKNVNSIVENMPSESCNAEVSETGSKLIKSGSPNLRGKNEPALNTLNETVHMDADKTKENKGVETNVNFQELAKVNETHNQCSESYGISKELCTSKASLISPNEPEIEISCNSNLSKMAVENAEQTIHKDVSDKSVFAETLSIKRKLESKNRSLKKRRKQGCHEERSIKKAGDIRYSVDYIKTMLNIMKQFI